MNTRPLFATILFLVLCLSIDMSGGADRSVVFRERLDRCSGASCIVVTDELRLPLGERAYLNGITDPRCTFIDSESQWCEFWSEVSGSACDPTLIDFDREAAVVLALGSRPDTCHTVWIDKVCREGAMGAELNVLGIQTTYSENCGCFTVPVRPLEIIRVTRPVSAVTCYTRTVPVACGP